MLLGGNCWMALLFLQATWQKHRSLNQMLAQSCISCLETLSAPSADLPCLPFLPHCLLNNTRAFAFLVQAVARPPLSSYSAVIYPSLKPKGQLLRLLKRISFPLHFHIVIRATFGLTQILVVHQSGGISSLSPKVLQFLLVTNWF